MHTSQEIMTCIQMISKHMNKFTLPTEEDALLFYALHMIQRESMTSRSFHLLDVIHVFLESASPEEFSIQLALLGKDPKIFLLHLKNMIEESLANGLDYHVFDFHDAYVPHHVISRLASMQLESMSNFTKIQDMTSKFMSIDLQHVFKIKNLLHYDAIMQPA